MPYSLRIVSVGSLTSHSYLRVARRDLIVITKAALDSTIRVLGLVKRLCGRDLRDVQTRKLLYTALVRPLLEYSSSVWSPYSVKHRRLIENFQRRATKFILNYPPREVSCTNRLQLIKSNF